MSDKIKDKTKDEHLMDILENQILKGNVDKDKVKDKTKLKDSVK